MKGVRALLFDMDGVVVDSNPVHCEAWAEYNQSHGMVTTPEMRVGFSGKRNDEVVRDFFGTGLNEEEIAAHGRAKEMVYRSLMRDRLSGTMVPGVRDFLQRHAAFARALVTNAEMANVDFVLDGCGLRQWFGAIVTGGDVARPKPYPDIYLRAAEMLDIRPAECVVFEDSPIGVASALAAGMRVVGVATSEPCLDGATLMIGDFEDPALERWIGERL